MQTSYKSLNSLETETTPFKRNFRSRLHAILSAAASWLSKILIFLLETPEWIRLKNKRVKRISGACRKSHLGKFDEIFAMNFTRR